MKYAYDFRLSIYPNRKIGLYKSRSGDWKQGGFFCIGIWIFHFQIDRHYSI